MIPAKTPEEIADRIFQNLSMQRNRDYEELKINNRALYWDICMKLKAYGDAREEAGARAERERCAKICEEHHDDCCEIDETGCRISIRGQILSSPSGDSPKESQ